MFKVFMKHPEFEKIKDHQLDVSTIQNLSNILEQVKTKVSTDSFVRECKFLSITVIFKI